MTETLSRLTAALADRYRVERELGAGGMATVYLAHDLRHERDVAIKVLHPDLGAVLGGERFLAEIKTTARLQHPHILPLLDSGVADGLLYYVMPFVKGETLRARLEREKQLPLADAVRIAREVAGALDHAHKQGIIHRDIKPENILLQDGAAVVADFGIALAVQQAGGQRMTQTGLSLGTPHYMSPEQAMGEKSIDARSDIYALGAVTYEMLAGEPPFTGPTTQVIVAKVLSERPVSLRSIRESVSANIDGAVLTALTKTPADRFSNAGAFADALTSTAAIAGAIVDGPRPASRASRAVTVATLGIALVFATLWWRNRAPSESDAAVIRMVVEQEAGERLPLLISRVVAISPDGSAIAFTASLPNGQGVMLRRMGDIGATPIAMRTGQPSFSLDGSKLLMRGGTELYVGSINGGTFSRIPSSDHFRIGPGENFSATWLDESHFLLSGDSAVKIVSVADGSVRAIALSSREAIRAPLLVRNGGAVIASQLDRARDAMKLVHVDLQSGAVESLGIEGVLPLGWVDDALVFVTASGDIMAVPMNGNAVATRAAPRRVAGGVLTLPGAVGVAYAAMSNNGHLIYADNSTLSQLVRAIPGGAVSRLLPDTQDFEFPRYSPDGKRIAVAIADPQTHRKSISVLDVTTGTLTRVTDLAADVDRDRPEWSADGTRVIYRVSDGRKIRVAMRAIDQAESERFLEAGAGSYNETVMARDGRTLIGRVNGGSTQAAGNSDQQVYAWQLGDTVKTQVTRGRALVTGPRVSPDARWVAYSEDSGDGFQVYVTSFPGPGPRIRVNRGAGGNPVWRRDGQALYFTEGDAVVEVSLRFAPGPIVVGTRTVSQGVLAAEDRLHAPFDAGPNGDLIGIQRIRQPRLIIVRNFASEVRRALRSNAAESR